jgi:hypothetical protein
MELRTRNGKRVVNIQYKPYNSSGNLVTFPLKGTIILSEKPLKTTYQIFSIEGKLSLFGDHNHDIMNVPDITALETMT